ncbi:MAG: response regulator transcription factor [Burkholderiales bacterium]|nr:response regulator transcription factor [Burkholderiales bacterium]
MKFLIIDDHPIVRDGVAAVLRQVDSGVEVLEAGDGAAGLAVIAAHSDLDCVLLDLRMTGLPGMPTLEQVRAQYPALPLVIVSSSEDAADARRALAAGARGYIPKSAGRSTMLAAVRLVLAGEVYVPPLVLAGGVEPARTRQETGLTERQMDVLRLVCEGLPNREIGQQLDMHEKTVKAHVTAVFKALGVVNREQAIETARAAGLVG